MLRRLFNGLFAVSLAFVAALHAQAPANPGGLKCDAVSQDGRPLDLVTLHLDETGVSDWRFQNPVKPFRLCDADLQVKNDTGNRTFVITIPYVYKNDELGGAYSAARVARGQLPLREVVCRALDVAADVGRADLACDEGDTGEVQTRMQSLETLRLFREMVRQNAKGDPPEALCDISNTQAIDPSSFNLLCHLESLYWTAACHFFGNGRAAKPGEGLHEVVRLATDEPTQRKLDGALRGEAARYVARRFAAPRAVHVAAACDQATAACLKQVALQAFDPDLVLEPGNVCQNEVAALYDPQIKAATKCSTLLGLVTERNTRLKQCGASARPQQHRADLPPTPIAAVVAGQPRITAEKQFATSRIQVAARELVDAIDIEMDDLNRKLRLEGAANRSNNVLQRLHDARTAVQKQRATNVLAADCHSRNLEAAARLVASYDDAALVPYRELPRTLYSGNPEERCPPMVAPSDPAQVPLYDRQMARATERKTEAESQPAALPTEADVDIVACETEGANTTCVATATILPNQMVRFRRDFFRRSPEARVRLTVAYFNEIEPPPNANAHLIWPRLAVDTLDKPKGRYTFGFGADATTGYDLPKDLAGHLRHTSGSASLTFQYAGPVDVSATLRVKNGDFGGAASSNTIEASQYQAKIFGQGGWTLQYGRMTFAQPTAGIAVSEKGEGLRAAYKSFSAAYLVSRESDAPDKSANSSDDDSDALILQWVPPLIRGVRQVLLTAMYGEEKNDHPVPGPSGVEVPVPYEYYTVGADLRVPTRTSILFGVGAYHSRRDMRPHALLDDRGTLLNPGDSQGNVFLASAVWNRITTRSLIDPPSQTNPAIGFAAFLGRGTGDNPATGAVQEGYIGEHAGYANDFIFLRTIAASDVYGRTLGRGLSNKTYAGLQYTDARWSPLSYIAQAFRARGDIVSRATILGAHYYRFNRKPAGAGEKGLVYEFDAEFKLEAPRNVRWFLKGGFLHTPKMLEQLAIPSDPWILTTGVSIALDGRS
jgi:hypothetical protein